MSIITALVIFYFACKFGAFWTEIFGSTKK